MAKIEFLGPIGIEPIELEIGNLKELKELWKDDAKLQNWLEISAVAINDELITDIDTEVKKDDKITLLPPVCGG